MDFGGRYLFGAKRAEVWAALNDAAVLGAVIPGCQTIEWTGADTLDYSTRAGDVSVDLQTSHATGLGTAGTFSSIETIIAGASGTSTLIGSNGASNDFNIQSNGNVIVGALTVQGFNALQGGAGASTAGGGTATGIPAIVMKDDLSEKCPGGRCGPSEHDAVGTYDGLRWTAGVSLIAGALIAGGGVAAVLLAPENKPTTGAESARVLLGPTGASVEWRLW